MNTPRNVTKLEVRGFYKIATIFIKHDPNAFRFSNVVHHRFTIGIARKRQYA